MKLFNIRISGMICFIFLMSGMPVFAQLDAGAQKNEISLAAFLERVKTGNLGYAAEKFNVSIARAEVLGAKVFPDPELSFGLEDVGERRMKMGYAFNSGLSYNLELGGKRKARISIAERQAELSELMLSDYFRNLQAEAAIAFLEVQTQQDLLKVKMSSYEKMKQLSTADSIRFRLGAITAVDARQSRLEAASQLNEVFQQEADWRTALAGLNQISGTADDKSGNPAADLLAFDREFKLQELIVSALNQRADLQAAIKNRELSQGMLQLAKANRLADLGISAGVTASSVVANSVAPTPSSGSFTLGMTIPLKFSNRNKGALISAAYQADQTVVQYRETELQIQTEVTQAYFNYLATSKQVKQFSSGMLEDAREVRDGKIYSYKRGETSLLEVLNAQRTFNEVQQNYLETLKNNAVALVGLEKAAGIWDLNL
ncbi:outer membrane protein, cobalt-zinc-cadmium efflux system [Pedobacter antarcticus]|uniref:Outer membrane protein, cobalt-zinc-cadmium efflux system n=1 Tax=Pedobacter antarcticus TaxID=34086 RepID=A0A1I2E5C9_9SPHI|nr:TolC family protein [Pedobacter antarcticus]SFE87839.1 outer membrane protein, cobalt-zinc-cadmium efflux system [Pedobacter antarcticus]